MMVVSHYIFITLILETWGIYGGTSEKYLAGVGWKFNSSFVVFKNNVTWYETIDGCQSKGLTLYKMGSIGLKYLANQLNYDGFGITDLWVDGIKPAYNSTIYNGDTCTPFELRASDNLDTSINNTKCLASNILKRGKRYLDDCNVRRPFLCFNRTDLTSSLDNLDNFTINSIEVKGNLVSHSTTVDSTLCSRNCRIGIQCVFSEYKTINQTCTTWKDSTDLLSSVYTLTISPDYHAENSLFIKSAGATRLVVLEDRDVYNITFSCLWGPSTNTIPPDGCPPCVCTPSMDLEAAREAAEELKKNLTVDQTTLSSYRRKRNCAQDSRPLSVGIGYVGVSLLVGVALAVVMLDITHILAAMTFAKQRWF